MNASNNSAASSIRRKKSLKSRSKKSSKSEYPELPICKLNPMRHRSEFSNSDDPGFELSPKISRDYSDYSDLQSLKKIEESSRINGSTENFCGASRPTRYCGEKATDKVRCCSRAPKSREERHRSNTPNGTVGLFDSMKKLYKNRVRPFFANKSTRSLRRVGKIFKGPNNCSGKSSAKGVPGRGISHPSLTDVEFPIMESKVTWTSGSNTSLCNIEPENWPNEESAISLINNPDVGVSAEDRYSQYKEEVPVRSGDIKSKNKKTGSVLACCIKPATSPTETQTSPSLEDQRIAKKRRWNFKKPKNRW